LAWAFLPSGCTLSERRGREIGLRRVLGVSARSIVVLMTGEFTGLVLTASLVVCPLITLR